jgi:HK97 family phage major capsid protein
MDKKLNELRQARGKLCDELEALIGKPEFEAKAAEINQIDKQIADCERAITLSASRARPSAENPEGNPSAEDHRPIIVSNAFEDSHRSGRQVRRVPGFDHYLRKARLRISQERAIARDLGIEVPLEPKEKRFRSFGEQLMAVFRHYADKDTDPRLVRAPTGAGEVDPSGGGFLVQTDFSAAIWMRAYDLGEILARVEKFSLSTTANGIKIPGVDEQSRATGSRWGGVQSYWVGEGSSNATGTKPKFRLVEFDLKKLMSLMWVSDELLADQSLLAAIAGKAFSEEIMFMTEDGVFEGTGAGMPLGVKKAAALIVVPAEVGQASKTILYENVEKMWSRCWARSRAEAIWQINQDCEPQLYSMAQVIGTAGVPVYMPANGLSGEPYGTLFGRPVIAMEYSDTVGTQGDISLVDYSQYGLVDKGGIQAATSMHVAFLTDEQVFRITYRVDGRPMWNTALTPFKGSNTLSPFVQLAAR